MKKNFIWSLLAIMLAAVMSVGFIACDDDDDNSASVDSAIVGKWYSIRSWGFVGRDLRADGSYYGTECESGKTPEWYRWGSWSASNGTLTIVDEIDKEEGKEDYIDVYTYTISSDGKTLYLVDEDGDKNTWTRE